MLRRPRPRVVKAIEFCFLYLEDLLLFEEELQVRYRLLFGRLVLAGVNTVGFAGVTTAGFEE